MMKSYQIFKQTFLRYNLFNDPFAFFNSGVSFDIGYKSNQMKDFYLSDVDSMNLLINRFLKNSDISIFKRNEAYFIQKGEDPPYGLENPFYISMEDTQDLNYYTRILTGFYSNNSIMDFYFGYRKTHIKNKVSSTPRFIEFTLLNGEPEFYLPYILDRDESMWFFGFNYSLNSRKFIYEINYEYEKFLRESGLDYVDFNHVLEITISYEVKKDLLVSLGGKVFYRQLNGEIPYLYNSYTQTTFDHKYGFATLGIQYTF